MNNQNFEDAESPASGERTQSSKISRRRRGGFLEGF